MATRSATTGIRGASWGIFLASVIMFLTLFFLSNLSEIEVRAENLKKLRPDSSIVSTRLYASDSPLRGRAHPLINGEPIREMRDEGCLACHTQLP